jgi:hypothetical protein
MWSAILPEIRLFNYLYELGFIVGGLPKVAWYPVCKNINRRDAGK